MGDVPRLSKWAQENYRVLLRGRQEKQSQIRRQGGGGGEQRSEWCDFWHRATSQECGQPLETGKCMEIDSLLEPPGRTQPRQSLDLSFLRLIVKFRPLELSGNTFGLFESSLFFFFLQCLTLAVGISQAWVGAVALCTSQGTLR